MKIAIIALITIVVIEQLSFGVIGCGKHEGNGTTTVVKPDKPKKLKDKQTLPNGITFNMKKRLGFGISAYVYEGQTKSGAKIAVKVFNDGRLADLAYEDELSCYKKMDATAGDDCKKYGIPPVLYHGDGAGSKVLVLPLYSNTLISLREKKINVSDESALSMMQQGVITIKYMHSNGVVHGDLEGKNMMIELNQVFIIDYGMYGMGGKKSQPHDMRNLFLEICLFFKIKEYMEEKVDKLGAGMGAHKEQIIKEVTAKNVINSKYVKPLVEIGIEVADAVAVNRLPNYDTLHKILEDALYEGKDSSKRILFNWLTEAEKAVAREIPIGTIDSISPPKG